MISGQYQLVLVVGPYLYFLLFSVFSLSLSGSEKFHNVKESENSTYRMRN